MKKLLIYLFLGTIMGTINSCDKEETTPDKVFVGKWQTAVYESYNLEGNPVAEQMTFIFTNNTFEDKIQQGTDANSLIFASAIKGTLSDVTDSTMNAEINELSVIQGIYINKENNPDNFQSTWDATLGKLLNEQFVATYIVNGDKMQMILPVKFMGQQTIDTLNLNKIN